jgi:PAS domain S-box-containing protein
MCVTRLTASNDLLVSIVLSTNDAIFALDSDRRIRFWNAGATVLFGYAPHDVVGEPVDLLIPTSRRDEIDGLLDRAMKSERLGHFETTMQTKAGASIPVSVRLSPVRDGSGDVTGASVIVRDVVARRNEELTLRRRSAELERSNAELEQFAQIIAHDLQEPVRTMKGFADLLEKDSGGALEEQTAALLDRIVEGATRMQELVADLLDYARAGTKRMPTDVVKCEEALEAALADLEAAIREGEVVVSHDELPLVRGDRVGLTEVFENLIGNAMKFRGPDVPAIHVGVERRGPDWCLWVQDNGIGIGSRFAERIFEPFRRLHTRDEYSGSGMGLAICRKIVERHGGRIWVESEPGKGSTFFFTRPAIE